MDSLLLPYLGEYDTLRLALDRMKESDSRAIVVEHAGNQPRLYMNREVVNAFCEQRIFCVDLPRDLGQPVGTFGQEFDLSNRNLLTIQDFIEEALDQQDVLYGIPFMPSGPLKLVLVVTRQETYARQVDMAAKVCMCPDNHTCESPPNPENGTCAYDGKAYECY
jgi:hypothetical protein